MATQSTSPIAITPQPFSKDLTKRLSPDLLGLAITYLPRKDAAAFSLTCKTGQETYEEMQKKANLIRIHFGKSIAMARPLSMLPSEYYQRCCVASGIHARGIPVQIETGDDAGNISSVATDGKKVLLGFNNGVLRLVNVETGASTPFQRDEEITCLQIRPLRRKFFAKD